MEGMEVKVSVVIPVYNVEKYVVKTLDSLVRQTRKDFEIIAVNDGSTDRTAEVIQEYILSRHLARIKLVNQRKSGVSAARNKGLGEADVDYVYFLDGDDYVHPDLIERIYKALDIHKPDMVFWDSIKVDEKEKSIDNCMEDKNAELMTIFTGKDVLSDIIVNRTLRMIGASGALYSKSVLNKYGITYTNGCMSGEDQEFILKNLTVSEKVVYIKKTMLFYLQRKTSITGSYNIRKFDYVDAFTRTAAFMIQRPGLQLIEETFLLRNMVENYFYNINSCLLASRVSIKHLLRDVEKDYPGINAQMIELMKEWKSKGSKNRLIDTFLLHPVFCQLLLMFRHYKGKVINIAYRMRRKH
ncbi:putative glycosyltransferase EpsJ [compost metagenome]